MPLIIDIKVTPNSGRSTFCVDASGSLKAFLKSPPEGGKANKELITLLAKGLDCPPSIITIVAGATTRKKKIKIDLPLTYDDIIRRLGFAIQTSLIK